MITPNIRETYPNITSDEVMSLTTEELNKLSISLHEKCAKDYKVMLGGLFKDKNTDYPDWYKDLLREGKTSHERTLKELVLNQKYLREGLNPPYCYPKSNN